MPARTRRSRDWLVFEEAERKEKDPEHRINKMLERLKSTLNSLETFIDDMDDANVLRVKVVKNFDRYEARLSEVCDLCFKLDRLGNRDFNDRRFKYLQEHRALEKEDVE